MSPYTNVTFSQTKHQNCKLTTILEFLLFSGNKEKGTEKELAAILAFTTTHNNRKVVAHNAPASAARLPSPTLTVLPETYTATDPPSTSDKVASPHRFEIDDAPPAVRTASFLPLPNSPFSDNTPIDHHGSRYPAAQIRPDPTVQPTKSSRSAYRTRRENRHGRRVALCPFQFR
ncbi:unnamed protein product [Vicia faba]|uniref:Uncharacterized protein n=1 Tax=Vicia faba TaxID=3906 RepID=A0AAV1AXF4_VICFA|nr:unnamed protein product [Vicia faba]